jgi:hypothetical protein
VELAGKLIAGIIGIAVLFTLYFAPAIVADMRNHPSKSAITVVNIFLGWTLIGWVAALAWALMGEKTLAQTESASPPVDTAAEHRIPCPFCAEAILPNAKKCKHCGSALI